MEPIDPRVWKRLEDRAAGYLPPTLAERVLEQAHRRERTSARVLFHPFALSGLTAAACLFLSILMHSHAQAENLAEWQELAAEADTLSDL
jgi:hypothetical protein